MQKLNAFLDRPRVLQLSMLAVLLLAGWLRLHGRNWDEGKHLHPDERFLSSVTNDLKWPDDFKTFFDPTISTLSPYSLPNMGLYVYGTLPVYIVKSIAIAANQNNYDQITLLGRSLSGLFDLGAILFLFLLVRDLYGKKVGLLAALLLALSVLNIQLSHFYAVDTFANLFVVATMYFLVRASTSGRWSDYALTGVMLGLGMASKLSVLTLAVPILVGTGFDLYRRSLGADSRYAVEQTIVRLVTLLVLAAFTFRIFQPIAFSGPTFWDWSLNSRWLRDISEQQKTVSGQADPPWIQQWTGRSAVFPLVNIVLWGLGLPLGLAGIAGLALATFELVRRRRLEHLLPVTYVIVTFAYHAGTFVKFMRYFLPIYPFLAMFAAYAIARLWEEAKAPKAISARKAISPGWRERLQKVRLTRPVALVIGALVVFGTLLYALAFSGIYSRTHSRVAASRWIYQNIPAGSTLANEHWDDWLPIGGLDGKNSYGDQGMFAAVQMINYEDDTPAKLEQMLTSLSAADYLVLSSNRLYDSIPRLPMRYPMTTRYYELLFSGQLGFARVAEFTSYPAILGLQLRDQPAEESFSVYDHPRVQIFRKTGDFSAGRVRQLLSQGINWSSVVRFSALQATAAPNGLLLTAAERELYDRTAGWSSARISDRSPGSRVPVLAWFLALQLIGLLAVPVTFLGFRHLVDRGYAFSKVVGLLFAAWAAWMLASLRVAPFTWWTIIAALALLTLISAASMVAIGWQELRDFVRLRWRLLVMEEVLFWLFFAALLLVRWSSPDLWHPGTGGEKPMDVAYLTAIVRTPYFPSYDPWFASGYINYYYFGFVLVATLVHLTSIVPTTAYNLAVPMFFAMTAMGGFAIAVNLAERRLHNEHSADWSWRGLGRKVLLVGLCGALFVAVIGNLGQVQLLWNGVRNLSSLSADGEASPFALAAQFADGLGRWMSGEKLPIHTDWWYWNATRVIPAGEGEAGPINELPFFTFIFADLHAHMMALPYTLLALGLAIGIVRGAGRSDSRGAVISRWRRLEEPASLVLLALATGALWPMNTWDFPTYTALAGASLVLAESARRGRLDVPAVWAGTWKTVLVVLLGRLLFQPFHQAYASAYFGAELWKGSKTPVSAYLVIHGFFLFVIASYLISEFLRGVGHNALVRRARLGVRHWRRRSRLIALIQSLAQPTPGYRMAVHLAQLGFVAVIGMFVLNRVAGLALALALLTALLILSRRPAPPRQFILGLVALGFLLTATVEIVVLKGDISRMNTVFKFYLQVWVLWAVVSAAVLPIIASRLGRWARPRQTGQAFEVPEGSAWTPEVAAQVGAGRGRTSGTWARRWWTGFSLLLAGCLLYPLTAAPVRMRDRFEGSTARTLDGTAYMRTSVYYDEGRPVTLDWDRQAIEWLRQNVRGLPTIVEASTPLYRWGSRVSIYTGLPTVIGWDWHQKQQRSILPGPIIDRRIEDVRRIYTSTDVNEAVQLLGQYGVKYIYLGQLENLYYAGEGLAKFEQPGSPWRVVYQNEQVRIFEVY